MCTLNLLDCTLRDGGYLNDWEFGYDEIITVFERLVSAGIDIIEVGFIDERRVYDRNRTIFPDVKSINCTFEGIDAQKAMVVGMIDYGTCSIEKVIPAEESFLDGIRVIFKKHIMREALEFCSKLKALGYSVFVQAVSITSYNDEEFATLLELVNEVEPYAFSIVDTYGLLHKNQLIHYFEMANDYLKQNISLGYHSHNNFQLGYANCIELAEKKIERNLLLDGSLYGMGKGAGNTPIELLAMYVRENRGANYHISQLLEAIDVTIQDCFRMTPWGYSLKFFVAASNDCHPNYVAALMEKKKLSVKSINEILATIPKEQKLLYNNELIEELYRGYQAISCDDNAELCKLVSEWKDRKILLIAPGKRAGEVAAINEYKEANDALVVSVNFIPENIIPDYVFMSNAKRYVKLAGKLSETLREERSIKTIATSNVTRAQGRFDYVLEYESLLDEAALIKDNPIFMLLELCKLSCVKEVALAGFDGYEKCADTNYVNPNMEYVFSKEKAEVLNEDTAEGIKRAGLSCPIVFVTKSLYERFFI